MADGARPPAEPPLPSAAQAHPLPSPGASRTWMWQEISESSSSRMVHFISWLSDLVLELRKWIIFMVLLPLGTQWQEANMHRGPGERAGGWGRLGAHPREHRRWSTHRPGHLDATQPRDSRGDRRLQPHLPGCRAQQAGPSLLLPLRSLSFLPSRALPLLSPPPPPGARSCASLGLGSLSVTPARLRCTHSCAPASGESGGTGGRGAPQWPAPVAAASGWARPPPPAPRR